MVDRDLVVHLLQRSGKSLADTSQQRIDAYRRHEASIFTRRIVQRQACCGFRCATKLTSKLRALLRSGPGGSDWACLNAFTGWGRRLRFELGIQIAFVENSQKWQGAVHSDYPRRQLCPLASGNALTNSGVRNDRRGMRAVHRLHHQVVR